MRKNILIVPAIILIFNFLIIVYVLVLQPSQRIPTDEHGIEVKESGEGTIYIVIQFNPDEYKIETGLEIISPGARKTGSSFHVRITTNRKLVIRSEEVFLEFGLFIVKINNNILPAPIPIII